MKNKELLELLQKAELNIYEINPDSDDGDTNRWKAMNWVGEAIAEMRRRLNA